MKLNFLILILVFSVFLSCASSKDDIISSINSNSNVIVVDVDEAQCNKVLPFSSFLRTPETIVLETSSECIIKEITSIELYKKYIYILDAASNRMLVFNRDGSFSHRIGRTGKGQGESIELSDFSIDRENNIIYLWDEAKDMAIAYDITTGKYHHKTKTERNGTRSFCMQYLNGKIYANRTAIDGQEPYYLLKEIDTRSGEQIAAYLEANAYNHGWNYPVRLTHSYFYCKNSQTPKFVEMFADTVISLSKTGLAPYLVVKSKDMVSWEDISKLKEYSQNNNNPYSLDYITNQKRMFQISRYTEGEKIVTFQYLLGNDRMYLIYDKKKKNSRKCEMLSNDYVCKENNIPMDLCYCDEDGVLSVLKTDYMDYFVENVLSKGTLNPNISNYKKLREVSQNSNPILFYHRYK